MTVLGYVPENRSLHSCTSVLQACQILTQWQKIWHSEMGVVLLEGVAPPEFEECTPTQRNVTV